MNYDRLYRGLTVAESNAEQTFERDALDFVLTYIENNEDEVRALLGDPKEEPKDDTTRKLEEVILQAQELLEELGR